MSKKLKLILIFVFILAVIFIGYLWYQEPKTQKSGSVKGETQLSKNINQNSQSQPRLVIISPQNGERIHSGFVAVRYLLTGNPNGVTNIDILLNQSSGGVRHYAAPIDRSGQGLYPLTNLAAGEYNLMMRLINKDGNFFNQPGTQSTVYFMVED